MKRLEKNNLKPNVTTFNCLLGGHARMADIDGALKWFEAMQKRGIVPNRESYKVDSCLFAAVLFSCPICFLYIHGYM